MNLEKKHSKTLSKAFVWLLYLLSRSDLTPLALKKSPDREIKK
jgi:hypothetical protein